MRASTERAHLHWEETLAAVKLNQQCPRVLEIKITARLSMFHLFLLLTPDKIIFIKKKGKRCNGEENQKVKGGLFAITSYHCDPLSGVYALLTLCVHRNKNSQVWFPAQIWTKPQICLRYPSKMSHVCLWLIYHRLQTRWVIPRLETTQIRPLQTLLKIFLCCNVGLQCGIAKLKKTALYKPRTV